MPVNTQSMNLSNLYLTSIALGGESYPAFVEYTLNPITIIRIIFKVPINGGIQYRDLDWIPDNLKSELTKELETNM